MAFSVMFEFLKNDIQKYIKRVCIFVGAYLVVGLRTSIVEFVSNVRHLKRKKWQQ